VVVLALLPESNTQNPGNGSRERNKVKRPDRTRNDPVTALRSRLPLKTVFLLKSKSTALFDKLVERLTDVDLSLFGLLGTDV